MNHYQNLGGNSGVSAYEIGEDSITVQFKEGAFKNYKYTNASAGSQAVEKMKQLAVAGVGLNSYISTTVKKAYASKW
jgi:hypothetical protein